MMSDQEQRQYIADVFNLPMHLVENTKRDRLWRIRRRWRILRRRWRRAQNSR